MTTATLWGAYTSFQRVDGHTNNQELGLQFTPSVDGFCTGFRWYAPTGTVSTDFPTVAHLWRVSDGALLATKALGAPSGVGWQTANLTDPISVPAGVAYIVSYSQPGHTGPNAFYLISNPSTDVPSPTTPLALSGVGKVVNNGSFALPTGTSGLYVAVDVLWASGISGGTGGVTPGDVGAELASWLVSTGDNTHQTDGLPWRTDANITTVKSEAEGASGFAAIKSVADTVATSVGAGIGTAVSALTTAVGTANTALTHAATTWSDALAANLQALSDNFASFGASKSAQGGGNTGAGTFPANVGTLVWTMLAETDFSGSIAWAQPADIYVLSITTRPHGFPLNLTDGVHTVYRAGWWTPLNGSFGRQRSYIDFEDNHLQIGAERMPGVLVSLQPGGEAHLQAWALT